jgi:hypothetical protein
MHISTQVFKDGVVPIKGDKNLPSNLAVPAAYQGKLAKVACGAQHIVAVLKDGSAVAWGDETDGKLTVPAAAKAANAVISVVAGAKYSVFLLKNGSVLRAGLLVGSSSTVVLLAGSATAIASGDSHVVVALAGGKGVIVLGDKTRGQGNVPPATSQLLSPNLVTAIVDCSYALTTQGLVGWGPTYCHGTGNTAPSVSGPFTSGFKGFSALRSGFWYNFADADYGTPDPTITLAVQLSSNRKWTVYDVGTDINKLDGSRRATTGRPVDDMLPVGDMDQLVITQSPLAPAGGVPAAQRVVEYWARREHESLRQLPPDELIRAQSLPVVSFAACFSSSAVTSDGTLWAWGAYSSTPAELQGKIASVACSSEMVFVILKSGGVVDTYSSNDVDPVGVRIIPPAARPPNKVLHVGVGRYHAAYLVGGNVVQSGQMVGPIVYTQPLPPDVVAAAGSIIDVAAGPYCAAALSNTGRVFAWGLHGTNCRSGIPPEIASGQVKATNIAVGDSYVLVLNSTGGVLQWGNAGHPLPAVPPAARAGVSAIAAGAGYSLAIKDKMLLAWGKLPCEDSLPAAALVQGAVCWVSVADSHFVIRLCNGTLAVVQTTWHVSLACTMSLSKSAVILLQGITLLPIPFLCATTESCVCINFLLTYCLLQYCRALVQAQ